MTTQDIGYECLVTLTGPGDYVPRLLDDKLKDALRYSPAVVIEGLRGCGKTNGWKTTLNTPTVHHGDRIADHIKRKPSRPVTQKN
ncbi:MAG: hypothetical protein OXT07_07360 [bacterium]|nr:hypothetical protein [bacterium]